MHRIRIGGTYIDTNRHVAPRGILSSCALTGTAASPTHQLKSSNNTKVKKASTHHWIPPKNGTHIRLIRNNINNKPIPLLNLALLWAILPPINLHAGFLSRPLLIVKLMFILNRRLDIQVHRIAAVLVGPVPPFPLTILPFIP